MTTQKAAAIVLVMIGIVIINIDNMVLGAENSGSFFGDALVFLAMIPEALFSIFSKKVTSRVTEWGTALISGVVTSLGIAPFLFYAPPSPQALPGFFSWPWLACPLLLLSGLLTLAFYILWSYGLKKIPVSTAGIFGGLVSIVTSLLGYFFLGENFGVCDGIGLVVVFTALFLGTYKLNRYSMTKNV
jgi:drug/metabolite transporter (DMT)-like permease